MTQAELYYNDSLVFLVKCAEGHRILDCFVEQTYTYPVFTPNDIFCHD